MKPMTTIWERSTAAALLVGAAALAGACSDDAGASGATTTVTTISATGGGGASTGGGGASATGGGGATGEGGAAAVPEVIRAFDAAKGELPEGLAVRAGEAYVGFAPTGVIVALPLDGAHEPAPFGTLPAPVPNQAFMTGLALDAQDRLYAAMVSFTPDVAPGIYRVPAAGGDAALFASAPDMVFPNGLAFASDGALLVTDSAKGAVFRVATDGTVAPWLVDPSLSGQVDFCGPDLGSFDIGANGIAITGGAVFVANNDRGSIVRIPIEGDGSAGPAELFVAPDCDRLGGADGLVADASGNLWVAVNRQNRLVRIDAAKTVTVVGEGGTLDFPASLAFGDVDGTASLLVTSFALAAASSGGDPHPSLGAISLASK